MLPSVVEYLYDELDGISDFMSPVQPLLTQAVTDNDHSKRNDSKEGCRADIIIVYKNTFLTMLLCILSSSTSGLLH